MRHCDLTLPSPEENLACDEALLDLCEAGEADELLRFWEPARHFVVVGYANKTATEVNLAFCRERRIPVLRRCTGGGTVVQGPGCLNYSLVLRVSHSGPLRSISSTNDFVMQRHQETLSALLQAPVEKQGHTDLALDALKFSGNAQRRRSRCLLFHGCFLLHLDIGLIEQVLPLPSRQPEYRCNRSHSDFLMNLNMPVQMLKAALLKAWNAAELLTEIPSTRIATLVRDKYGREEWNLRF